MSVALLKVAASVVVWLFIYGYTTWWVMLMFGVTHSSSGVVPPLGYWQTLPIVVGLSSIVAAPVIYLRFAEKLDEL